jgi:protein-tyrosine phosphatase
MRLSASIFPSIVLIVCNGNICRSPYAAAVLRGTSRREGFEMRVESAGFIGPGRPVDRRVELFALKRELDLTQHRSQLLPARELARFQLILAMTRRHRSELIHRFRVPPGRVMLLGDFDPEDPPEREIPDPFGVGDATFKRILAQIDRSIAGFVQSLPSVQSSS